ncbi:MAG: 4-(cytidine 5'-diphospho)-2-C-methyl-D-erythritol kinase, partial [Candidatus Berkiellales bacterium]
MGSSLVVTTTKAFSLPSPAKINHFLHIVGKRHDGYHLLQTLYQFLDYGDLLHFELREDNNEIILSRCDLLDIPNENNLIYRAAKALQKKAHCQKGVNINIEKQIPLGSGLGGGSSNAATTLIALNALWDLNLPVSQLMQLGEALGADVPIFIFGHSAWGEGIGEKLTPVDLVEPWFMVITPSCQVMTAHMFADPHLTRNTPPFKIEALANDDIHDLLSGFRNDFEPLVRRNYPEVDDAMKWLSNFGKAQLSGSGASVF